MVRHAFTMIELIFAIVIIGIIALSFPIIMVNNSNRVDQNLLQEAVFMGATKLGQVLTFSWDQNSRDPNTILAKSEVLDIPLVGAAGDLELDRNISDFRQGHFQQPLRRRMRPENEASPRFASATLGSDGELNDIDDFNATVSINYLDAQGYKNIYQVTGSSRYVSDSATYSNSVIGPFVFDPLSNGAGTAQTNIKMLEVTVDRQRDGTFDEVIKLHTFSSNIGETDYYKRTY